MTEVANSTQLERDSRLVTARDHDIRPGDIAIGVIIGRTSEFFDFFVYALASVLVFPKLMFPFGMKIIGSSPAADEYAAIDAEVLPVETQATRFIPNFTACATPQVIPLSLKDPVGLNP